MNEKLICPLCKEEFYDKDCFVEHLRKHDVRLVNEVVTKEQAVELRKEAIKWVNNLSDKSEVRDTITNLKQEIINHFNSENKILVNAKDEMLDKEYEYRKHELERQRFYIMLIVSKFSL